MQLVATIIRAVLAFLNPLNNGTLPKKIGTGVTIASILLGAALAVMQVLAPAAPAAVTAPATDPAPISVEASAPPSSPGAEASAVEVMPEAAE